VINPINWSNPHELEGEQQRREEQHVHSDKYLPRRLDPIDISL